MFLAGSSEVEFVTVNHDVGGSSPPLSANTKPDISKSGYSVNPWIPESDPRRLKVLGKFGEELTECATAVCRAIIQGIDEEEPQTKKVNRQWLMEEIADVRATLEQVEDFFDLDEKFIEERVAVKKEKIGVWLRMLTKEPERERRESRHEEISRLLREQG